MRAFLKVLRSALSLVALRKPRAVAPLAGMAAFWIALIAVAMAGATADWFAADPPRRFESTGLAGLAFHGLWALALAAVFARHALRRPALVWTSAGLLLLLAMLTEYILRPIEADLLPLIPGVDQTEAAQLANALWIGWITLALTCAIAWLAPERRIMPRLFAALLISVSLTQPRYLVSIGNLVVSADSPESTAEEGGETPAFDPELVMSNQPALLGEQLTHLFPQRPGKVDLYLLAVGGDAEEDVFRNEVEYAERLFLQRFEAGGRTLVLLNHAQTTESHPLATRTNLRAALSGIARIIDRDEDVVMLFLTSHGSADHQFFIKLDPLPLHQITPKDLREALDAAGIRHRVVVVSACYAGGFLPALRDADSMVIAAAREDRPSFGCGSDSELTWFGRAFLVDALNHTADFRAAFDSAQKEITQWEDEQHEDHSFPQIASTPAIEARLARWRDGLHPGFPVPFRPAGAKPLEENGAGVVP